MTNGFKGWINWDITNAAFDRLTVWILPKLGGRVTLVN